MTDLFNPRVATDPFFDVKITSNNKMKILNGMVYMGQFHALEAMIGKNAITPYKSVDEMIGDMQILMVKIHGELKKGGVIRKDMTDINHLIKNKQRLDEELKE